MTLNMERLKTAYPEWFEANGALWRHCWDNLDARILELIRLTLARHLKCQGELSLRYQRGGEDLISAEEAAALPIYYQSTLFSPLDRAAIAYAEQQMFDAQGVTDDIVAALAPTFQDEGFYKFALIVGMIESWCRLRIALGETSAAPAFGADARAA